MNVMMLSGILVLVAASAQAGAVTVPYGCAEHAREAAKSQFEQDAAKAAARFKAVAPVVANFKASAWMNPGDDGSFDLYFTADTAAPLNATDGYIYGGSYAGSMHLTSSCTEVTNVNYGAVN